MLLRTFALAFAMLASVTAASAEPTTITVRAISKDAKFIGTSIGGMQVTVTDAQTGEVLAKGVTSGGTGSTARLMDAPRQRGVPCLTRRRPGFPRRSISRLRA